MSDTVRRLILTMAATAVVLHVWAPSVRADGREAGRETTTHVVVGLSPSTSFSVFVEDEELPSSPVVSSDIGIAAFAIDDAGFPPGPLTVRIHPSGELVITGVEAADVTMSSALIRWTTNLPSNSLVEYGETPAYGWTSPLDPGLVIQHEVELTGLSPGTTYHFRAISDDGQGHLARSSDHQFTTALGPLLITGVHVEDAGATWAIVRWTTNRSADSQVEYGFTPAYGHTTPVDPVLTVDHAVMLIGLVPGATYHFRALSSDGQGASAQSADHTFETGLEPLTVSGVEVLETGPTWATVGWVTNHESDSQVEYGETGAYGEATPVDPAMVTDHAVTLAGLSPGTLYHFRARSEDEAGQVAHSADRAFVTPVVPLTISSLNVTEVGATWAVIEWLTDRPASTLVAYGPTSQYGLFEDAGEGFVTEHSATLTGLAEAALYHFRAVSVDENDVVGVSPDSTFTTKDVQEIGPPAISSIAAVARSATCVHVTWATDRPATSQVCYGTGGVLDCATEIDTTLVTEHGVAVGPVVPAIEYSFVVVSACGGDTAIAGPHTFATPRPPEGDLSERVITIGRPGVPVLGDTTVVVRWSTDRPCSTWVEWGPDASYGSMAAGRAVAHLLHEATAGGLSPETLYHYRVCALSEHGSLAVGEDRTFETRESSDDEPPAAPAGLSGRLHEESIELSWTANQEADLRGYFIYRARAGLDGGEWSRAVRLNEFPVADPWYVDAGVERGSAYAYGVAAVDLSWNESAQSATVVLEVPGGAPGQVHLAAFPNPATACASLAFSVPFAGCPVHLRILSTSGRVVHEAREWVPDPGMHTVTWDTKDVSGTPVGSGVYLCEVALGERVARQKLTVLR